MKWIESVSAGSLAVLLAASITAAAVMANTISEKYDKAFPLSADGSVSLRNVNGNVGVSAWDKNEVKITAVKYADDEEELGRVIIEVNPGPNEIAIRTKYPDRRGREHARGATVDYVLTVPRNANLDEIMTVNGNVEITGVTGKLSASTVNGFVDARGGMQSCELSSVNGRVEGEFTSLPHGSKVSMKNVNGKIVISLPLKPDADIEASSTSGRIRNEFGLRDSDESGDDSFVRIGASLKGKLGNGDASIRLRTVSGSIEILRSGSGR